MGYFNNAFCDKTNLINYLADCNHVAYYVAFYLSPAQFHYIFFIIYSHLSSLELPPVIMQRHKIPICARFYTSRANL